MLANHFGTDHDRIHQELCDFERSIHHAKIFLGFEEIYWSQVDKSSRYAETDRNYES